MNQKQSKQTFWQQFRRASVKTQLGCIMMILFVVMCVGAVFVPQIGSALIKGNSKVAANQYIPGAKTPIHHIVIIDKENRTFDSMFGTFPNANGATTYTDPHGNVHPLNHQPDKLQNDILHNPYAAHLAYDNGKMDKFSKIPGAIQNGVDESDSQFYQSDIPNYWSYAQTFTLSDNFFSTILGPSFPNHLFSIAGVDNNVDSNPKLNGKSIGSWGCDSPSGTLVQQRATDGTISHVYPCFNNFQTLGDLLNANHITWKYYQPGQNQSGYIWASYDAIAHIRNTGQWQKHISNYQNFVTDAASGNLPTVSWLVEPGNVSDHAPGSICAGENFTVQQINAIMSNQSLWSSTAIILTWDDFGGFFDHAVPPQGPNPQIEYGFRAPTIIMSPYARPNFVDHTFYSYPSILKYVEDSFSLPSLGGLDATSNDMFRAFNFKKQPAPPLVLQQRSCASSTVTSTVTPPPGTVTPTVTPTQNAGLGPRVSITSPIDGSGITSDSQVTIAASASSNAAITKVEFYVDDKLLCTVTKAPYTCNWNVPANANPSYTLMVMAYDADHQTARSSITVTINYDD